MVDHPRLSVGQSTAQRWCLAVVAGLLNGAAFIDFGALSLIANVPLLLALYRSPSATETACLGGLVGFLGGLHIYGIAHYGWYLLIAFALYTASQMVVYALLFRLLWKRTYAWVDVLLPANLWALSEWLRTVGPVCMPASYVGNIADVSSLQPWLTRGELVSRLGGCSVFPPSGWLTAAPCVGHSLCARLGPRWHDRMAQYTAVGWAFGRSCGGASRSCKSNVRCGGGRSRRTERYR